MADLNELEKVGKQPVKAAPQGGTVDTKGAIWTSTAVAIATYVDDPGEFTFTTQGCRLMQRQQRNRQVSYLELSRDGRTTRIEVYDITGSSSADDWPFGGV